VSGDRIRLEVSVRDAAQRGSRVSRRLRRDGLIPGVLYGKGDTRAIAVPERALRAALTGPSGMHGIVDVVLEGQTTEHHAVLKDYQQHPLRGTITHVDFHEVRLDQPIQTAVTVRLSGEAAGTKAGGVLTLVARELNVEALPMEIPEYVDVDVSAMEIGDTLRLSDVPTIEGVTFLDDPDDTVIANVAAPRTQEELEELEAPAEGEVEEAAEGEAPEAAAEAEEAPAGEAGESEAE
jgi:large subunit ribosomal protein L25